jgi:hypothetical protein
MRALIVVSILISASAFAQDLRIGIVGTDTSHVPAFTRMLNADVPNRIPGARVVAAFKGGSPDLPESANRVEKFAAEISEKYGVELVPDIPTLCSKVDAVLLESVDGRVHLDQAKQVIAARKPFFVDKPLAATLEDARAIADLARKAGVRWFSSSSLRFSKVAESVRMSDARGALVWGPGPLEQHHHLDMSWYGVHAVELLYTLLGTGCESVARTFEKDSEVVVGRWKDGRLGTVRLLRPYGPFGAVTFGLKEAKQSDPRGPSDYRPLLVKVIEFFKGAPSPVNEAETMEIFAFMDAAQRSREQNGARVPLR